MQKMMNPMNANKTALERAFELAGAGLCHSIADMRRQLIREGFDHSQLAGACLMKQLVEISRKARAVGADGASPGSGQEVLDPR